jgi:hypothetical protein
MSDVFISYARQEAPRAEQLARALQAAGFSVWWDHQMAAGATWANSIEQALNDARCIVVMWSANSVKSDWVLDEAAYAREEGKLIPVLVDKVRPPLGFGTYQSLELTDWDGKGSNPELQQLIQVISGRVRK